MTTVQRMWQLTPIWHLINTQNHWWRKPALCKTSAIFTLWQLAPVCFISDSLLQWFCVSKCDSVTVTSVHVSIFDGPEWTQAWNNISDLYEQQRIHLFDWQLKICSLVNPQEITVTLYVCQNNHSLWFISSEYTNGSQWIKMLLAAKWCNYQY